jgi:hypothetical protein
MESLQTLTMSLLHLRIPRMGEPVGDTPCLLRSNAQTHYVEAPYKSMYKKLAVALTAVVTITFGCGKSDTYKVKDGEVKVDKNGGQVTFQGKSKDGNVTVTTGKDGVALPDNFPKDVPIYKGAVVQVASTQGKMMMVQFVVAAPATDTFKYYQDQLKEQGWEINSTVNMGEGSVLAAKKGERECTATVMKEDKGSRVSLTVTQAGS